MRRQCAWLTVMSLLADRSLSVEVSVSNLQSNRFETQFHCYHHLQASSREPTNRRKSKRNRQDCPFQPLSASIPCPPISKGSFGNHVTFRFVFPSHLDHVRYNSSPGKSWCLEAFIVALSQASEGGEKRWYASTLQLQLASLEMCSACRNVPTVHVRVDVETPPTFWSRGRSKTLSNTRSSKVRLSSRVPVVRAAGLTWGLPVEVLVNSVAMELWTSSEFVKLWGSVSATSLNSVNWPKRLWHLVLAISWLAVPVAAVRWPPHLRRLDFGGDFNQPIVGVVWPASLQQISFGRCFNQPIVGVVWPASLQQHLFKDYFNQALLGVVWPASLQQLSFGRDFNQPIVGVVWPTSLQRIFFGSDFNQPIVGVVWPVSLQHIAFGWEFDQPIVGVVWSASLIQLSFGSSFNQPIVGVVWPASLRQLSFGEEFNQPIVGVVWPASLHQLSFGDDFNQPVVGVLWPASLQQLSFGKHFNQTVVGVV